MCLASYSHVIFCNFHVSHVNLSKLYILFKVNSSLNLLLHDTVSEFSSIRGKGSQICRLEIIPSEILKLNWLLSFCFVFNFYLLEMRGSIRVVAHGCDMGCCRSVLCMNKCWVNGEYPWLPSNMINMKRFCDNVMLLISLMLSFNSIQRVLIFSIWRGKWLPSTECGKMTNDNLRTPSVCTSWRSYN